MNKILIILSSFFILYSTETSSKSLKDSIEVKPLISHPVLHEDDSDMGKQIKSLNYESAKKTLQNQINQARRKKQSTKEYDIKLSQCEKGMAALRGTNKIVFMDSVVVDKDDLLSAYQYNSELGKITLSGDKTSTDFTTELGNLTYRTELTGDSLSIRSYFIEDGKLSNASSLNGIDLDGDMNYPFLLSDGTTFYFSSRSNQGLGNYDIYVTRYDSEDKVYLQPTNLGFPFNSYANDYLMVIDEDLGIGWFASDRYQPSGKVCVYTFIQPKARRTYDYETDDHSTIINAARIRSIKDTWQGNEDAVRSARQSLVLKQNEVDTANDYEFSFIINDNYTYHYLADFKNQDARLKFLQYQKSKEELNSLKSTLDQLRLNSKGNTIRSQIIEIENHFDKLSFDLKQTEKQVRQLELQ